MRMRVLVWVLGLVLGSQLTGCVAVRAPRPIVEPSYSFARDGGGTVGPKAVAGVVDGR